MARGDNAQATQLFNQGSAMAGQGANAAGSTYNQLFPTYSKMARGESTPGSVAANTASQQSVGGSESGLLGQGQQQAARTGNSAGFGAGLDKSMRSGGKQLSNLANQNKSNEVNSGLKGLSGLYSGGVNQEGAGLGAENQAVNSNLQSERGSWWNRMLSGFAQGLGSATSAG